MDRSNYRMHHKYAIVDNATLVIGSYNWMRSAAEYNEENLVVQYDRGLVRRFRGEFEKLWNSSSPV